MDFRLLFICTANICRSPTAHGVFRHKLREAALAHRVVVDSAGTHDMYTGRPPDERARGHARERGYDLADLRARKVRKSDFSQADLLLYMDDHNRAHLQRLCPVKLQHKLRPLTSFCHFYKAGEVPDPFAGSDEDFDHVLNLIEDACEGLLHHVRQELARRDATPG